MSIYKTLYSTIFRSNIAYLTYIIGGAIVLEYVYSGAIDAAWSAANRGVSGLISFVFAVVFMA